jgi:arsenite methyltransferase
MLHAGSLTQLPFADGALNGVLTVNTVYFIAELDHAITELGPVIGSSGRIVMGLADPEAMAKMPFTSYGFNQPSGIRGH